MLKKNVVVACLAAVSALAAVGASLAAEANLSGTWDISITSPQGTRRPTMFLTQTGDQVSGTYKSTRGEVPVTGQIKGNEFRLTVKLANNGQDFTIEYTGTVNGDALTGMVGMGRFGNTGFTGKRAL